MTAPPAQNGWSAGSECDLQPA